MLKYTQVMPTGYVAQSYIHESMSLYTYTDTIADCSHPHTHNLCMHTYITGIFRLFVQRKIQIAGMCIGAQTVHVSIYFVFRGCLVSRQCDA